MDHDDLDARLDDLVHAFETGDRDLAAMSYRDVEQLLGEHFAAEEQLLFPEFATIEPRETEELLAEHREIKRRLDELGIGVDLHATRLPAIGELAQMLREHAAREDALLYRWAAQRFADPALHPTFQDFFA